MNNPADTAADLEALRALDTPSVCNAIELVAPERRARGFTTRTLHCVRPALGAMVGYARTATVRAKEPAAAAPEAVREKRFAYLDYLESGPGPTVSVVQDLDGGEAGFGSFWGEVNSNVHKALGCLGTITDGSARDLDVLAEGFQILCAVVAPSHGYIHLEEFGCPVRIAGMAVESGDLIHADRHGAVVVPAGRARAVADAAALVARREAVILAAARGPGADAAAIKQAMIESAKVS